jgi:N-acetyl-gamma-glutamyl-phosphate/LysW-gamma-L-alpha-aminoadipyl-6-phosphate reductase
MNVGVIAASGYAGGEVVRLLLSHPKVKLNYITSRKLVAKYFHTIYPNLRTLTELKFEEYSLNKVKEKCDIVFLGVPHGISQNMVPELMNAGLKIIDLSADFRLKNPAIYHHYYKKEHKHPELLNDFVYGLPELHREDIRKANLVAVAGCHASSAIYGLYPLIKENLIQVNNIIVDSKTGSSGSGARVSESTHHPIRANSLRPYKMTGHRHTGEIEQELNLILKKNRILDQEVKIGFSAHAINLVRGILSTSHVFYNESVEINEKILYKAYRTAYKNEPFVRLITQKTGIFRLPDPKSIIGTNYADVGFQIDDHMNRIVILCALDNLVKGTAGNAIQCMNLICGFPETLGLEFPGYFPA